MCCCAPLYCLSCQAVVIFYVLRIANNVFLVSSDTPLTLRISVSHNLRPLAAANRFPSDGRDPACESACGLWLVCAVVLAAGSLGPYLLAYLVGPGTLCWSSVTTKEYRSRTFRLSSGSAEAGVATAHRYKRGCCIKRLHVVQSNMMVKFSFGRVEASASQKDHFPPKTHDFDHVPFPNGFELRLPPWMCERSASALLGIQVWATLSLGVDRSYLGWVLG